MNIQDFIVKFAATIGIKNSADLNSNTVFWELDEWTSLSALAIVSMIDEEYGVFIRNVDLKCARTIQDIFTAVTSKRQ